MTNKELWDAVNNKLRQVKKDEKWPVHIVAQSAKAGAATGELMAATLELKFYELGSEFGLQQQQENIKQAAINSIVQAVRFAQELNF